MRIKSRRLSNNEKEKLEQSIGDEPSLNRYVIGVFLDGTAEILDTKTIKQNMVKLLKDLGTNDFVETESKYRYKRGRSYDDIEEPFCKIHPFLFMKPPKSYVKDRAEWDKKKAEVDKQIKDLKNQLDVLLLKINLGSPKLLEKLIEQIDSLGELDLFSNKLTLIAEGMDDAKKLLENKK